MMSPDVDVLFTLPDEGRPKRSWGPERDEVVRLLIHALADPNPSVIASARTALGRVGDAALALSARAVQRRRSAQAVSPPLPPWASSAPRHSRRSRTSWRRLTRRTMRSARISFRRSAIFSPGVPFHEASSGAVPQSAIKPSQPFQPGWAKRMKPSPMRSSRSWPGLAPPPRPFLAHATWIPATPSCACGLPRCWLECRVQGLRSPWTHWAGTQRRPCRCPPSHREGAGECQGRAAAATAWRLLTQPCRPARSPCDRIPGPGAR